MAKGIKAQLLDPEYAAKVNRIIDLRCQGYSLREISADPKVLINHVDVMKILDRVADMEFDKLFAKREMAKKWELVAIERQIRELSEAWERSKRETKEFEEQTIELGEGVPPGPGVEPSKSIPTKYSRRKKFKGKMARDGGVGYQEAITKLRRLKAEILGIITPPEKHTEERGYSVLYVPVPPGTPGAKPHRPFEFPKPKQVYELDEDNGEDDGAVPPELMPDAFPQGQTPPSDDSGVVSGDL